MNFEPVIGLEVHVQLATTSKLFSYSPNEFGAQPNSQANFVDTAQPGVLPVVNRGVVDMAIFFGLAVQADIDTQSVFARKHYFYPDLPKGYQISQYDRPILSRGSLLIDNHGVQRNIGITRAHLEEDAGKSLHGYAAGITGIDLNRAGCPLLEIVSDPVLYHPDEAISYLKAIHRIVRWLGISDGDMSQGSMRCDANISVRAKGTQQLGTRVEIKNLNSFRFVHKALQYEIARQQTRIMQGKEIVQETRLFDTQHNITRAMRSKEEALDYRYFPDPDLPILTIDTQQLETCKQQMIELPDQAATRYQQDYGLNEKDAQLLTQDRDCAQYFDAVCRYNISSKRVANWLTGEMAAKIKVTSKSYSDITVQPQKLAALLQLVEKNTINNATAKDVFSFMWDNPHIDPETYVHQQGLAQLSDTSAMKKIIDEVLAEYAQEFANYQSASVEKQKKLLSFFVGKAMQKSQGKANPKSINQLLRERL